MALSFIGANSASGSTITIPAIYQPGDLVYIFAFNGTAATAVTVPTGWNTFTAPAPANVCAAVVAYVFATVSGIPAVGTWTNATAMGYAVYRGTRGGMSGGSTQGSNTTIAYTDISPSVVMTTGSDWRINFMAHTAATNVNAGIANFTNRATAVTSLLISDSNGAVNMTKFGAFNQTVNTTGGWTYIVAGLKPAPMQWNNYEGGIRVQNGMSGTERIR